MHYQRVTVRAPSLRASEKRKMHTREMHEAYVKGVPGVAILKPRKMFYDVNCRCSVIVLASYICCSVSDRYDALNAEVLYRRRTGNTEVFATVRRRRPA